MLLLNSQIEKMKRELLVKSNIESLREVEKFIDQVAYEQHLDNVVYGNILIATLEAANNAIIHGNKLDVKKEVFICLEIEEKLVKLEVKDEGTGFDFMNIPDPTAPENIENISGRGVFLMSKLSDSIAFSKNGATVELTFNLP
jgi:serine/threonine-protein kinase RsbW